MKPVSKFRTIRAACLGLLTAVLLIGSADLRAMAEDDDDDTALDTKILRNVLKSLGLRRGDEGIDYRERSPLVVPPSRKLPAPETASSNPGSAWPNDPDVRRARQAKSAPVRSNPDPVDASRPLRPDQYQRSAPANPDNNRPDGTDRLDRSRPMSPAELEAKSLFSNMWRSNEEYATFGGEPPRANLTEPPAGYRTPSSAQPYGVGKQKWDYKPIDRMEPVR